MKWNQSGLASLLGLLLLLTLGHSRGQGEVKNLRDAVEAYGRPTPDELALQEQLEGFASDLEATASVWRDRILAAAKASEEEATATVMAAREQRAAQAKTAGRGLAWLRKVVREVSPEKDQSGQILDMARETFEAARATEERISAARLAEECRRAAEKAAAEAEKAARTAAFRARAEAEEAARQAAIEAARKAAEKGGGR